MQITDLVYREAKAGKWRSEDAFNGFERTIYHYGTAMITFGINADGKPITYPPKITHLSLGWGSVSDQNGMNRILEALGSSLYYSRKGGAEYIYRKVKA